MQSERFLFGKDVPIEDIGGGIKRQILGHNDELMLVKAIFEDGAVGYQHQHYHSQVTYVESGVFDVVIDGVTKQQSAGDSYFIPPNVMHGATCLKAGVLLDMFSPIREDFFENYEKGGNVMMKGKLRWFVVGLVALATIINYIDRQTLSVLWPTEIAPDLFPDMDDDGRKSIYGTISVVFIFSYAFGQAIFGRIFDWVGTRLGFVLSIGVWSLATIAHAFAKGVVSFSIFRSILGISEAGNWPGAAKANAEWFPVNERALAQGIFNSGAAIGGIVSIPLIGYLALFFSWKLIFIAVGVLGLLWLVPWLVIVKAPPKYHSWITDKERAYILSGQVNEDLNEDGNLDGGYNPPMGELLSRKQSWGIIIASAAIDPIWWLFIIWIPTYLFEAHGFLMKDLVVSGWVPYVGAMFGAWFGGLLAQNRIDSGWSVDKTRKLTITLGCLIMLPSLLALAVASTAVAALTLMFIILFGFQPRLAMFRPYRVISMAAKLLVQWQALPVWLLSLPEPELLHWCLL